MNAVLENVFQGTKNVIGITIAKMAQMRQNVITSSMPRNIINKLLNKRNQMLLTSPVPRNVQTRNSDVLISHTLVVSITKNFVME